MDSCAALSSAIAQALANGATVLTANQRAARTLQHGYNLSQQAAGFSHWTPPDIFAWDTWLASMWRQLLIEGKVSELLLSAVQEHTIWRAIIAADPAMAGMQAIDALAKTAAEAWLLLHRYDCRSQFAKFAGNSDTRAFAGWMRSFERRCGQSGYVTHAQLSEIVRNASMRGEIELRGSFLLVGFDAKTPAQVGLLDVLRTRGITTTDYLPDINADGRTLAAATDEREEIVACATWVRERIEDGRCQRVAVVVPALDAWRAEIDREFRRLLAPGLNDIAAQGIDPPYEFSLGIALAHTPLVATALDLLRWSGGPLSVERISALLLARHFGAAQGGEDEALARAELDAFVLRREHLLQPSMTVGRFQQVAAGSKSASRNPVLLRFVREFAQVAARLKVDSRTHTCADWAQLFRELLKAAGFPAGGLDSTEFQVRRKWEAALDELATLDFDADAGPLTFAGALNELTRIAEGTLFAPETRHAPVQIMGPLESAGSTFDAIWFLHANDNAWPAQSATNALLPWHLQRELQMPGADPAHDAAVARRTTERIATSAAAVVFSYAHESSDGEQRPSAMLKDVALTACPASDFAPSQPPAIPIALDSLDDSAGIPHPPDRVLHGGASILQAQAACGFRAFAEKRLFSSALDACSFGLDPAERGNLIHAALEDFWTITKSQDALKGMSAEARDEQLYRSIDHALQRQHDYVAPGWSQAYIAAERRRLFILLSRFLDYERNERRPFTVRACEEKLRSVSIGPLRIDVRVDRIDTITLGREAGNPVSGEVIIDYKTGDVNVAEWLSGRPDAPQLPLYAVVSDSPSLAGIAFAVIRPGEGLGMTGYEAETGVLPKARKLASASLQHQVEEWRTVLEALADDFYHGEATVAPKKFPETCKFCAQRILCRLDISTLSSDVVSDGAEASAAVEEGFD